MMRNEPAHNNKSNGGFEPNAPADSREEEQVPDFESISTLIPRTKEGDPHAVAALVKQIQDYINLMAARHMDISLQQKLGPSDIVQQTLTQVIENFDKFRGKTEGEFLGWLKTIVLHEIGRSRRTFRAEKRDIGRETQLQASNSGMRPGTFATDTNPTPSTEAMAAEELERFHRILAQLPVDYAEVIRLRSLQQLKFAEIGQRMGRTENSARKLWYRAVLLLEEELNKQDW